jgi:leucyl aminopeptidase
MIVVSTKNSSSFPGDVLVVPVLQTDGSLVHLHSFLQEYLDLPLKNGDFTGKKDETYIAYPGEKMSCRRLLFIGIGDELQDMEIFRLCGGTAAKGVAKLKGEHIGIVFDFPEINLAEAGEVFTEGLLLGGYRFDRHKKPEKDRTRVKKITFYPGDNFTAFRKGVKRAEVAAEAGMTARTMANEPGNYWRSIDFAVFAKGLKQKYNLAVTVLGRKECQRLKMGGLLAVNQGSAEDLRLVIVEYRCKKKKAPTLLLVGKGLTFDSGGISLKPGAGMQDMKYDMCGGAAVMAAMQGIAREQPANINVIGIVPATDNMPGGSAVKPGDVITCYNGKTVEVINTDAEGRLILADALAYGVKKYKPDAIVDLATLTGAVIIGLGHHNTGLLANNDELAEKVLLAGAKCGEPVWRLPLGKEYTKQLKSEVADLSNIGGKGGGTITAAAFLEEFVDETPWVHLDIAGTAWNFTKKSYIPKGPSGTGARTLLELIRSWK